MKKYFDQYVNRTHKKKKGEVYDASGVEKKIAFNMPSKIQRDGGEDKVNDYIQKEKKINLSAIDQLDYP